MPTYLDHNATSPLRPVAREALLEALDLGPLNASSVHADGQRARALLDAARERVAASLGVLEDEVLFTGGGTEALNLAVMGAVSPDRPAAALATEHPAVLEPLRARSGRLDLLPVDERGLWVGEPPAADCALVALQAANSETGALQQLEGAHARLGGALLLVDAVQALGKIPVQPGKWGADLVVCSAHKVGGPQGVGVLIHRGRARALQPISRGGGQEQGLRAGTENVAAIHAASLAIEEAVGEQATFAATHRSWTSELGRELLEVCPALLVNGPGLESDERLPNTLNLEVPGVDGRVLVTRLDLAGLRTSAGSACASGSTEPSPVLLAMGKSRDAARRGLRLSTGWSTVHEDVHTAVDILRATLSPPT